jgi:hypothetical protein
VIPVGTTGQTVTGVTWSGAATTFTVNKSGTGAYVFNWTPAIPSTYVFFGNLRNQAGFVSFNGAGTGALNCQTITPQDRKWTSLPASISWIFRN